MKPTRVYLSGGMTNIPNFNFDLFDDVQVDLEAQGIEVDSPAEHDRSEIRRLVGPSARAEHMDGYDVGDVKRYMAAIGTETEVMFVWDFARIAADDGIVMLPGWETSTGARHERYVAEALGKPIYLAVRSVHPAGFWTLEVDAVQQRLTPCLATAWNKGEVIRAGIFTEINAERDRQDAKFGWIENPKSVLPGDDEHAKNTVLGEEVGEVAKAVLEVQWGNDTEEHLEQELVQVAAVAVAWLEARRQKAART